jgi:hypothetical protein
VRSVRHRARKDDLVGLAFKGLACQLTFSLPSKRRTAFLVEAILPSILKTGVLLQAGPTSKGARLRAPARTPHSKSCAATLALSPVVNQTRQSKLLGGLAPRAPLNRQARFIKPICFC